MALGNRCVPTLLIYQGGQIFWLLGTVIQLFIVVSHHNEVWQTSVTNSLFMTSLMLWYLATINF